MSRPQQRAPKGRDLDRLDRRNVVENLLARVHRVRLTSPEAALLGDYVREEQRAADATRSSLAGTTRALERNRQAADDAIRETEQRAVDAEEQLRQYRAVFGEDSLDAHSHALARASRAEGALAAVRAAADADEQARALAEYEHRARVDAEERADRYRLHFEQLRHRLATQLHRARSTDTAARAAEVARRNLAAILAKSAETPFDELTEYAAKTLTRAGERILEAEKRASTADLEATKAEAALAHVRNAQTLGEALAAVARHDGLTPEAATVHAAFTDAADSPRARLEEQAREHAIELAGARRTIHAAERALTTVRHARTWGEAWAALGMYYGLRPEECGQQAKARRTAAERAAEDRAAGWRRHALEADERADRHLAAWRSARARARSTEAELERIRGWCAHWADRTRGPASDSFPTSRARTPW
ncbi:hypothetical protein AB0K87_24395 [Streptomyces sp. NPDC053705]|uniref:hypothetical protein n=1 Tax=Streptomyces sp. NPDC053705 TaxID=3156668 RepID=UPI003441A403